MRKRRSEGRGGALVGLGGDGWCGHVVFGEQLSRKNTLRREKHVAEDLISFENELNGF